MQNELVSNCCKAELITNQSDEGTGYYSCSKCGKACDALQNEPQCNCIMSGFAQTTNYCPVHKGVPMKNVPQKMYRFKKWTSDEERAEVMKIIKYTRSDLIYQDSYDAHPELQTYFEPVEQNEPQQGVEREENVCPKCGGQLWRDEHPDGVAVGSWNCSNCDWYQETIIDSISAIDLPF